MGTVQCVLEEPRQPSEGCKAIILGTRAVIEMNNL